MGEVQALTFGYLLNALWQGPVVFSAAWLVARIARRAGAAIEHRVWVCALLMEVSLPACPVRVAQAARAMAGRLFTWPVGSTGIVRIDFGSTFASGSSLRGLPEALVTTLLLAYGLSVAYFAARLAVGLWQTHRMCVRAEPLQPRTVVSRGFRVCITSEIAGPVTVGLWRGVVLLPKGFLERVTGEDLRAVLAHESAHVRRRDFLKNALYELASLPIAFHPVLRLTRRQLSESREMVCDAFAAQVVLGRERYAESLLRLASMQVERTPNRMLHAIGIFGFADANSFERRLMQLTTNHLEMKGARRIAAAVTCTVLGLGTCATALALRIGVPMQSVSDQASTAATTARVSGAVMAGQVISKVTPVYPPDAKEAKISGAVVLRAVIGRDGTVENLQVVSGPEKLRTSALDAVRQWTYKPYLLNGVAVPVETMIEVTYSFS